VLVVHAVTMLKNTLSVTLAVLIASQTFAQNQNEEDAKKVEAFYQKINETISHQLHLYLQRSNCIVNDLKNNHIFYIFNNSDTKRSYFSFEPFDKGYNVTFISQDAMMRELQPHLDSANFSCTIVGYFAIIVIVTVMLLVVTGVSCLSKKK